MNLFVEVRVPYATVEKWEGSGDLSIELRGVASSIES